MMMQEWHYFREVKNHPMVLYNREYENTHGASYPDIIDAFASDINELKNHVLKLENEKNELIGQLEKMFINVARMQKQLDLIDENENLTQLRQQYFVAKKLIGESNDQTRDH